MQQKTAGTMIVVILLIAIAGVSQGATRTMNATSDLISGNPVSATPSDITSTGSNPYIYDVGAGGVDDLDMSTFNLNNTGNENDDVEINANSVSSGRIFSFGTGAGNRPSLTINAPNGISILNIIAYSTSDDGGDVTLNATSAGITLDGYINARGGTLTGDSGGKIAITSAGAVDIGGYIYSYGMLNSGSTITITGSNIVVGGNIDSYSNLDKAGDVTLIATSGSVAVTNINAHGGVSNGDSGGNITVTAASGVNIGGYVKNYAGANGTKTIAITGASIYVAGNIESYSGNITGYDDGGTVTLSATSGGITLGGGIDAHGKPAGSGSNLGGNITVTAAGVVDIEGDIKNPSSGNDFRTIAITGTSIVVVGNIDSHSEAIDGGDVTLSATSGSVTVSGGIDTHGGQGAGDFGGNITIDNGSGDKASGTIIISGAMNASALNSGDLTIKTTGEITLGTLDADLLGAMTLESNIRVTIEGVLTNLTINGSNIEGFYSVDSDVYYEPSSNAWLNAQTYSIDENDGDGIGNGHNLKPIFPLGTVITIL